MRGPDTFTESLFTLRKLEDFVPAGCVTWATPSPTTVTDWWANAMVTTADGFAEREAAKTMIDDARQAADNPQAEITLGADKGYDAKEFIDACLEMNVISHVAQNTSGRRSAVPDAIAASVGYAISVQKRNSSSKASGGQRPWGASGR